MKKKINNLKITSKKIVIGLMAAAFFTTTANAQLPLQELASWREMFHVVMNTFPTFIYDDGIYKGQNSVNENGAYRHGLGAYYWADTKDVYFGGYRDQRNGTGIYIIGSLEDNREVSNCPGAKFFIGGWKMGEKFDTGTCYDFVGNCIYYGRFNNNSPADTYPSSGLAAYKFKMIRYKDNTIYVGEIKDGKRHGQGVLFWQNGDMYYGAWHADALFKGKGSLKRYGVYIYNNGKTVTRLSKSQKQRIERLITEP